MTTAHQRKIMKIVVQIGVRRSSMNFYCRNKQSEEAAVIAKGRLIYGQVIGEIEAETVYHLVPRQPVSQQVCYQTIFRSCET